MPGGRVGPGRLGAAPGRLTGPAGVGSAAGAGGGGAAAAAGAGEGA
jgi:hypothetical protein